MKHFAALTFFLALGLMCSTFAGPLEIGTAAPKTETIVTTVEGKEVALKDLAGEKGLLVIFSCNTCPFVIKWQDRYNGIAAMAKENGIGIVYLNSNEGQRAGVDSLAAMQKHATDNKYAFPYAVDANHVIADAFGATRTPDVFLFDKEMKLVYRGAIDNKADDATKVTEPYLSNAITSMVKGEKVAIATTASVGCGIKR